MANLNQLEDKILLNDLYIHITITDYKKQLTDNTGEWLYSPNFSCVGIT